jgi:hypothetical protein
MAMFTSVSKIAPLAGAAWGADILTGQREFPVYKGKKGEGFKEILDKEIERLKGEKNDKTIFEFR